MAADTITNPTEEVPMSTTTTRKATLVELRNAGGFSATGDVQCTCCGEVSAHDLIVVGDRYAGQIYWSRPFCSVACHDEWHYS